MSLQNNNNQSLWIQPYKLICPTINQRPLLRERLLALLDQSQSLPLTCVYSPAGFGKSTLVVNWLHERKQQYGWYSLDINDNDPGYFANHLIYSLHRASNGGCPRALALVQKEEFTNLHSLLAKAMMEIAQTDKHLFIVLDDVHTISNPLIAEALRHWLKLLPPQVHVIFCCQSEPPFSLSALRVKGQLLEIGALQLAFTPEETKAFLQENLSFPVCDNHIQELAIKTGGWPAAMQLITHAARSPEDLIDASGRLGLGANEVDSFLIHEVLNQQPDKLKNFLLNICVFEQFSPQLCDSFLDRQDSETLIFELEQRQMFIHRVQGGERWYRLQDIFRDSLLKQLYQNEKLALELQKKAVIAFLENELIMEAVQLGLQLTNSDIVKSILLHAGQGLYKNGQFKTLTKLFDNFPTANVQKDPQLTLLKAWVLLATYRENEVAQLLENQSDDIPAANSTLWAEHAVAQAQAAINVEDYELANSFAEQAIAYLKPDSYVSRTVIYSVLGQSALCRGDLSNALSLLKNSERLAFDNRLAQQRLWSMCLISDVYTAWGKIQTALEVQKEAIDMAHDGCIENVLHMEFLYRNRTHLLVEQGDLAQADKLLLKSEQVIEPLGHYGLLNIHVHRGVIALWRGQREAARNLAFQVNYLLQNYDYHTDWLAHALEFLLACQSSEVLNFEPHMVWRDNHLNCEPSNHFYQHYQRVHCTHLYMTGHQQEAIEKLFILVDVADKIGLRFQSLKNKLLLSLWLNSDKGEAIWAAQLPQLSEYKPLKSLWLNTLFCHESLNRPWADWNVWFNGSRRDGSSPNEQADQLLGTINAQYANPADLVTPKEMNVLLLIGEGLNNDEIGASMYIAVSTVKSHIRRLYRKLDISKRSQAIEIFKHL